LPKIVANELLNLLDPEGLKLRNFHIYSAYSSELTAIRQEKRAIANLSQAKDDIQERIKTLKLKEMELEHKIRQKLSKEFRDNIEKITAIVELIARIDFLQAKAVLVQKYNLSRPMLSIENFSLLIS